MTNMPTKTDLTSGSTTEAQFQSAIGDLYDVVAQNALLGPAEAIEIATDAITPTKSLITIDTESSLATDNLKFIVPTNVGQKVIIVKSTSAARVITVKHNQSGTGKILLRGATDAVLYTPDYTLILLWVDATSCWVEISRNFGSLLITDAAEVSAIYTQLSLGTAAAKNVGTSTGQLVLKENFGTAAFVNTGLSSGNVPTNSLLGTLAYLSTITASQITPTGVTPGTYGGLTVNAQGQIISAVATPTKFVNYAYHQEPGFQAVTGITPFTIYTDVIPDNTKGYEWGTMAYTPAAIGNVLRIRLWVNAGENSNVSDALVGAMFLNNDTNAVAARVNADFYAFGLGGVEVTYVFQATSTAQMIIRGRVGPDAGSTININGFQGHRSLGGVAVSTMEVWETLP